MGESISKSESTTAWIPVTRAAAMLKVTVWRVYQLLHSGALQGRKVDRTWLVSLRSVEARVALLLSEGGK